MWSRSKNGDVGKRLERLEEQMELVMRHLQINFAGVQETVPEKVRDLAMRGEKIEAIKLYREMTGASLKVSKEKIESLEKGSG